MKIRYTQEQADKMLQEQKARAFDIAVGVLKQHYDSFEVVMIALHNLEAGIAMTEEELNRLVNR